MDKTKAAALAAFAAIAGALIVVGTNEKGEPVVKQVAEAEVLASSATPAKTSTEVATKQRLERSVYSRTMEDGSQVYFARAETLDAGVQWTKLSDSPCRKRPTGTKASECMRLDPRDGKSLLDPGDENVLQPGEAVGTGCVETACAVILGEKP